MAYREKGGMHGWRKPLMTSRVQYLVSPMWCATACLLSSDSVCYARKQAEGILKVRRGGGGGCACTCRTVLQGQPLCR